MTFDSVNLTAALQRVVQALDALIAERQALEPVRALKRTVTRNKLAALAERPQLLCVGFQLGDLELEQDVPSCGAPVPVEFRNFDSFDLLRDSGLKPDLAVFRSHQFWKVDGNYDFQHLVEAPRYAETCVNMIWLWDHHHTFDLSGKMALLADVVLPMHETGADYLKTFNDLVVSAMPAASAQWGGPRFVDAVFHEHVRRERSNRLYGGFVGYEGFRRNLFIRECMERIPDHALILRAPSEARDIRHFGVATRRQRLVEWMDHKCSLVCALTEDVPIRLLDALLAGQIPLVPHNLNGFDRLIPPALQLELPIVRYDAFDVGSVEPAWRNAVSAYDRDGAVGAIRRHRYVMENHLMKHRLRDIILTMLNLARSLAPV